MQTIANQDARVNFNSRRWSVDFRIGIFKYAKIMQRTEDRSLTIAIRLIYGIRMVRGEP
jgi:hypothetical protein